MQTYKTGGKKWNFEITETDVYGEDAFFYFTFEGYENEKKIISGINHVNHEMLRIYKKFPSYAGRKSGNFKKAA